MGRECGKTTKFIDNRSDYVYTDTMWEKLKRFAHFRDEFEHELENEILKSERLRSLVLCGVFAVLGLGSLVLRVFLKPVTDGYFKQDVDLWPSAVFFLIAAAYEFGFRLLLGYFLKQGLRFPHPPRYVNAVVEISIPSLMLLFFTQYFEPAVALGLPPVFTYFLFMALATLRLDWRVALTTGAVGAVEYLLLWIFTCQDPALAARDPVAYMPAQFVAKAGLILIGACVMGFITHQIRKRVVNLIRTNAERSRMAGLFGQHVSPEVMKKLMEQREGGDASEIKTVCVMFLDIRNFTAYSQDKRPAAVVAFLNELFAFMVDSVDRCGGFVNKFLGDGFMAVFGAPLALPNASASALAASREILSRLHEEIAQGGLPAVRVGIGLHSGEVLTGEVGSARRKEYTVIGDVVNVASRVEQLCKTHQCELLLTRPVYDAVRTEADNVFEHLGSDEVKGRTGQIEVFSIREAD